MKYCHQIFKEINFEPNSISPGCNIQGIQIYTMPYNAGKIDLKEYGKAVFNALETMQEHKDICKGCKQIKDVDCSPKHNNKFDAININILLFFM